jgi:hypothetical protein
MAWCVSLTLAAAGAILLLPAVQSAAGTTTLLPSSRTITRTTRIAYLNCPEPDVVLTASVQRKPFTTGQLVTYKVSIRNRSQRPCGTPNGITRLPNPVEPAAGLLGPCGELSVTIDDSRGVQVYPGRIAVSCPAILGPPLAPGQTITTTGTWDQTAAVGYQSGAPLGPVPRGEYHLVIDGNVTLPVDLAGPPFVRPPATIPPRTNPLPPSPVPLQPLPKVPVLPPPATAPSTPTSPPLPPGHRVTRSAHVAFDGCAAKDLTLTVTVITGPGTSVPVRYEVVVHNGGRTPCGAAFRNDPPAARRLRVGPCGAMPATVVNASGVDVYPGPQIFMCPAFAGPSIAPHATVTATGTWPGTEYLPVPAGSPVTCPPCRGTGSAQAAPPGAYTLVVDDAVEVPFRLTASP